jgi:prephenate dehydrogenase
MTVQLTIIGLGQIGASIGLALENQPDKITRTGSDFNTKVMQQAQKMGAVDKTTLNLNSAVRNADLVILALPLDQVREMVEVIGPALKKGAVLIDTAPIKAAVVNWAGQILPEGCSYVGLTPVLNPRYLHSEAYGIAAAKADLFHDGLFAIVTPPRTNEQVVKLAVDLIHLLGADPLFVDPYEIDGLMATTHILPQLMSAALLNATLDKPGWNEARKVAGRAFAEVSGPAAHLDEAEALVAAAIFNRENVVRKLDDIIAVLQAFRQDISQEDTEALAARLKNAKTGVSRWWQERGAANWLAVESPKAEALPSSSDAIKNLFGFGPRRKKEKN